MNSGLRQTLPRAFENLCARSIEEWNFSMIARSRRVLAETPGQDPSTALMASSPVQYPLPSSPSRCPYPPTLSEVPRASRP